jgi:esterase
MVSASVKTLILLHGLASNGTRWWHFAAHSRLRMNWQFLRPNLRGHAGSSYRGPLGMDEWCEDLIDLLDSHRCPRAVLAGHCLGANIALHFAERYSERIEALVLIEPMPRDALAGTYKWMMMVRPVLRVLAGAARLANALGLHRRHVEPLDLEQWDHAIQSGRSAVAASPFSDLRYMPTAAYLQGLVAVGEPLPELSGIRAPAIALLSSNSTMTDPGRTHAAMQKLANVDIVPLEATHWIPTEQPDAMVAAIDGWVTSKERAAGSLGTFH